MSRYLWRFCYAINYYDIRFLIAVSIPYPWYGDCIPSDRFEKAKIKWHIRNKVVNLLCIYKN